MEVYSVDLKNEIVTVFDLGKKCVIISMSDDTIEFYLSDFGFDKEKGELITNDSHFKKYIKQNPFYLRNVLRSIFEGTVEEEIDG